MTSVQTQLAAIVAKVNTDVLADLQSSTSNPLSYQHIEQVTYLYGHMLEVATTIQQWTRDNDLKWQRFPLIALIEDKSDIQTPTANGYSSCRLNIVICMASQKNWKSIQREANTFEPVLRPIYRALMSRIKGDGYFSIYSDADMQHQAYDRKFWGTEDETKNKFNDYVDAIEIQNLTLKYFPQC